jgi:hypothetical protein
MRSNFRIGVRVLEQRILLAVLRPGKYNQCQGNIALQAVGFCKRKELGMSEISRRNLLKTAVAAAAAGSFAGARNSAGAAMQAAPQSGPADAIPDSQIKVPKIKFGKVEISRLVVGCNTFNGASHFNANFSRAMTDFYTSDKVVEVLHQCNKYGINAYNYKHSGRCQSDLERFQDEGGKMHLIVQEASDPESVVAAVKPLAIYCMGETVDSAYQNGKMDTIRDFCKRVRQLGSMVGVGSHIPEVLAKVENDGWDVDFYAGCVYNRRRKPDEIRKLLGGELPVPTNEVYLEDDPPRMYKVLSQIKKPCFAFKILAAGRVRAPEPAFRLAFESIKPTDAVFVGMFPLTKDEVKEDAFFASRHGVQPA